MKKVLTVDDSKVVRTMVARHLQPYGCQVLEAANGREGVDVARKEQPDLILLDVTMPVMDGRQALAEIRQDAALKGTPVVMLTAESGKDLVLEIAKLGVKGYIVKPFTKATFEAEVGKLLGGGSQPAAAAQPSTPGCVLVVDDSERVLAAARASLEASVKVLTASSGADAVAQFAAERPRVAVIDLVMPDMDGFQTLAALKRANVADVQYIALAVRGDQTAREKALKDGFSAVVEKPIQADTFVALVAAAAAPPEEANETFVAEDGGYPVIRVPDSQAKSFNYFGPAVQKALRSLAEDGNDRLIFDLADVTVMNTALVKCMVELMSEAANMGLKAVVCAPREQVVAALKELAETREAVYASREAAREAIGGGKA